MNLTLNPGVPKLIDERMRSGRYATPEEVIAAAVINLDQQERLANLPPGECELFFPGIREKIEQGLSDLAAGRASDGEAFFDELEREDHDDGISGGSKPD